MEAAAEHHLSLAWKGTIVGRLVSPVDLEAADFVVLTAVRIEDDLWVVRLPIRRGAEATLELSEPQLQRVRTGDTERLVDDDSRVVMTLDNPGGSGDWSLDLSRGPDDAGQIRFHPSRDDSRGYFRFQSRDVRDRLRHEDRGMPNRVLFHGPRGTVHVFGGPRRGLHTIFFEGPRGSGFLRLNGVGTFVGIDATWAIVRGPEPEEPDASWSAVHWKLASLLEFGGCGQVLLGLVHAPAPRLGNGDVDRLNEERRSKASLGYLVTGVVVSTLAALLLWALG